MAKVAIEEYSSESPPSTLFSENSIRYLQLKIQSEIKSFENVSETTCEKTFNLCDIVKDQILNFEDEPRLSKSQNNFRRIYIASELIVGICSIHDHIVDFAFTKIINDLLRLDKYKIISSKIAHRAISNQRKEKYFAKEAHTKLWKSLSNNESCNSEEKRTKRKKSAPEEKAGNDKEPKISLDEHPAMSTPEIPLNEIEQTLVEDSFRDERQFNFMGDMTEIRVEPSNEVSNLNVHIGNIQNENILHPNEISIREPFTQQLVEEDITQILQSGDNVMQKDIRKSGLSEHLIEHVGNITGIEGLEAEKLSPPTRTIDNQIHLEESEEWSLSSLEPVENPKKKHLRLITDKVTIIPNYSSRALHLNKNIEIQRVQVFEGPPRILKSMSPEYLMKTTAYKKFLCQNVRSSRLSTLYERNLTTEKRPVEPLILPKIQKRMESKITEPYPQPPGVLQIQEGLIEEVGERIGMRSVPEKSGVLADLVTETRHPEVSGNGVNERDIGVPMSRRTSPIIQPLDQEKINVAVPIPSPRIHQLQGITLESKKNSPPWFLSTKKQPPRSEFREFNYVKKKLSNYWLLLETQGMEKSLTVREFLLFEEDGNFANYLTVLRIVDKLSLQRQLFLHYKNGDILIQPFENPYVSQKQLLLQGKEIF